MNVHSGGPQAQGRIRPVTGPLIVTGILDQSSTNRIEFDILQARQKIPLFLDQARLEATLEQGSGTCIVEIEVADVQTAQILNQMRYPAFMIGHEHPAMNINVKFDRSLV